jgi:hypothetical protein
MTVDDEKAMLWIKENTPEDAVFAVNLELWIPGLPIGTDGGYWIPYYTGRKTTAGTMLTGFGASQDLRMKRTAATFYFSDDLSLLEELCNLSVEYIYIGGKPPYNGNLFYTETLLALQGVELLFQSGEAQVWRICR